MGQKRMRTTALKLAANVLFIIARVLSLKYVSEFRFRSKWNSSTVTSASLPRHYERDSCLRHLLRILSTGSLTWICLQVKRVHSTKEHTVNIIFLYAVCDVKKVAVK